MNDRLNGSRSVGPTKYVDEHKVGWGLGDESGTLGGCHMDGILFIGLCRNSQGTVLERKILVAFVRLLMTIERVEE